ncbi:MAG: zf-HC2 domain-containing protein [Myxococcota bacterium]|nr:zf-HC2 domain-containing protein [Myxococcales bacterium]
MNCREFVDFLMAYLDEELEPVARDVFEGHMGACPSCKDYLDTYADTIRLGRLACADDGVPCDAPEELVAAILAARRAE